MKSDGSYTYFAGDVAYHYDKLQRGFSTSINVFGADHIGYIPRMKAVVAAFTGGTVERDAKGKLKHWHTQAARPISTSRSSTSSSCSRTASPCKMSKRAGTFVTLRDVVDEVGRDPVRFMMLYRKNDGAARLRLRQGDGAVEGQSGLLRAVRARPRRVRVPQRAGGVPGARRRTAARCVKPTSRKLTDAGEIDLIKKLADFPRLIAGAARAEEPHRLAFYLYDLASALHGQWTRGNDSPHLRFIQADDGVVTAARLALIAASNR